MSKAKLILYILLTTILSSTLTFLVTNKTHNRNSVESENSYFTKTVGSRDEQKGKTIEAMVKRCESAELILKIAEGHIVPAIEPMTNKESVERILDSGICVGSLGMFLKIRFQEKICLPSQNLSPSQIIKIFLQWAQNNPNKLQEEYPMGYLNAFEEAFPCHK